MRVGPKRGRPCWLSAAGIVVVLLAAGCAPREEQGGPPPASDQAEQGVLEAHRALVQAYREGSIDGFMLRLSRSPEMVIFHPRLKHRWDGVEQAREGLLKMFGRLGGRVEWTEDTVEVTVRGDVGWITSEVLVESPAMETPFLGRGSEIWVREDGDWRLIHGHWSETPGVYAPDMASGEASGP